MITYTPEGAPIPSGVPLATNAQKRKFSLHRGYVVKAVYPDDNDNQTGFLEYIVTVEGQEYYGVLDMANGGGILNNYTRVRESAENIDIPFANNDKGIVGYDERRSGEYVWCLFIRGDGDFPVIVGSDEHVRVRDNPDYKNPSKADGIYERKEFNGLEFLIDNDGNFTLTHLGMKKFPAIGKSPVPKDASLLPYKGSFYKIKNDGTIQIELNPTTKITIDPVNNNISMENGSGTSFVINGSSDAITISTASGNTISISASGEISVSTTSGTSFSMANGAISMDGTGAKIKLIGQKVGIGSTSVELLNQITLALDQVILMATLDAAQVHTGNLGYPTTPPLSEISGGSYSAIATQLTTIRGLIASIQGTV